jgi:hypothetical protein
VSVQAMARVMESSQATGVTRMVLLLLANHESEDRGAWPSIERIAREAKAGVRTVQDAIARAKKIGELEVQYRAGPHGTNVYRVLAGLSTTATLPGTEVTSSRGVRNPRGADVRRESAPERKEVGVQGSSTASSSSHPTLSAPRPRDELFETLCELADWDFHALTKAARGTVNDVAKQLRSVGATPEEARYRADTYHRIHPTWEFTIQALAKHWPGLNAVRPLSRAELDEEYRQIAEEAEARRQAQ